MGDEIIAGGNGRPVQRRSLKRGWTAARRKQFLNVLASSSNVTLAASAVGLTAGSAYDVRRRDRAFAQMWDEAMASGYDRLEQALLERARLGVNDIEIEGEPPVLVGKAGGRGMGKATRIVDGRVEMDVKLAQWLLERHDKTVRGGEGRRATKMPRREAIEAKIVAKLEALKKQGRLER